MKSVQGKVVRGSRAGFNIRVENDSETSGGFLVIFESPTDTQQGGDYWVEKLDDVVDGLNEKQWQVEWDRPLTELLNRDTDS